MTRDEIVITIESLYVRAKTDTEAADKLARLVWDRPRGVVLLFSRYPILTACLAVTLLAVVGIPMLLLAVLVPVVIGIAAFVMVCGVAILVAIGWKAEPTPPHQSDGRCVFCRYALDGIETHDFMSTRGYVRLGPEVCPECGRRWPLVP